MESILNFLKTNKKTAITLFLVAILIIAKFVFDISWEDVEKWLGIISDVIPADGGNGGETTAPPVVDSLQTQ